VEGRGASAKLPAGFGCITVDLGGLRVIGRLPVGSDLTATEELVRAPDSACTVSADARLGELRVEERADLRSW
jgi:hypothetical protein